MLSRISKMKDERESGFTLIELLVVILIIGILAAIAIPMFLNQRKAAVDSTVKSDVSNAAKAIETAAIKAGSGGAAVSIAAKAANTNTQVITVGTGNTITTTVSDGTTLTVTGPTGTGAGHTGTGYRVTGINDGGDKSTTANGGIVYTSTAGGLQ